MHIHDVEKVIREYLPQVIHMSLATSRANKPWVCELHYAFDDDLNLYFMSKPTRRHSLEIADNAFVSGNIVKQHRIGESPRGIYFEGIAKMLTDVDENHIAFQKYVERFNENKDTLDESKTKNGHKFYKISVKKYYLFDAVDSKPSQKYELTWGKGS